MPNDVSVSAGPHAYERLSVLSGGLSGTQTVMISILVALGVLGVLLASAFVGALCAVSAHSQLSVMPARTRRFVRCSR